jgi:hypothetical protein
MSAGALKSLQNALQVCRVVKTPDGFVSRVAGMSLDLKQLQEKRRGVASQLHLWLGLPPAADDEDARTKFWKAWSDLQSTWFKAKTLGGGRTFFGIK